MSFGFFKKGKGRFGNGQDIAVNKDDIYIVKTVQSTAELINNGADGLHPYISANDLLDNSQNSIISGNGVTWLYGYTYEISEHTYSIRGEIYTAPKQQVTLEAADPLLDRYDVIVGTFNSLGEGLFFVVQGDFGDPAVKPPIYEETQVEITFVFVERDTTEPVDVTNDIVYEENTEFATSDNTGGHVDFEDANNPHSGLVCISAQDFISGYEMSFTALADFYLYSYNTISLYIIPHNTLGWVNEGTIQIGFFKDDTLVSDWVLIDSTLLNSSSNPYAFDSKLTEWQLISIPTSVFNLTVTEVNKIRITKADGKGAVSFRVDTIVLQQGIATKPTVTKTKLSEFINDGNGDITDPFITESFIDGVTLQTVTDNGNETTNDIIINDPLDEIKFINITSNTIGESKLDSKGLLFLSDGLFNQIEIAATTNTITFTQQTGNLSVGTVGLTNPRIQNFDDLDGTVALKEFVVNDIFAGSNINIDKTDPTNPIISTIPNTSAGVLTFVYFTGDEVVTTLTTFYQALQKDRGTVPLVMQSISVPDNSTLYFAQDAIGFESPTDRIVAAGDYTAQLTVQSSVTLAQQSFIIEVYLTDDQGNPKNSGVIGAPVGDLGFTVITQLTSGIIDLPNTNTINITLVGSVASEYNILSTDRVRYHVGGSKVGVGGGNITLDLYYGYDSSSFVSIPLALGTDDIINESQITGATASDALNLLDDNKVPYLGATGDVNISAFDYLGSRFFSRGNLLGEFFTADYINTIDLDNNTKFELTGWDNQVWTQGHITSTNTPKAMLYLSASALPNNPADFTPRGQLILSKINNEITLNAFDKIEGASQINSRLQIGYTQAAPNQANLVTLDVNGDIQSQVSISFLNTAAVKTIPTKEYTDLKTLWMGAYSLGQEYFPRQQVLDDGYLAICNTQTTDRPAPQPNGEPFFAYNGDISQTSDLAKQIIFGNRYTFETSGFINGWRVNIKEGDRYQIYSVSNPLSFPKLTLIADFTATTTGWFTINSQQQIVAAGAIFDLIAIVNEPDPTPAIFSGNWNYTTPNNSTTPVSGEIQQANQLAGSLLVNKTDSDANDRSVELNALTIGDIVMTGEARWVIQSVTDQTTYINFGVSPALQTSPDGVKLFDFETVVATAIDYALDPDYWLSNPLPNGAVEGLLGIDETYENITPDNTAYGVDILVQAATISTDWSIQASPNSSSSGGGGADPANYVTLDGTQTITGLKTHTVDIEATAFIATGKAATDFLKGDGSFDSNTYAIDVNLARTNIHNNFTASQSFSTPQDASLRLISTDAIALDNVFGNIDFISNAGGEKIANTIRSVSVGINGQGRLEFLTGTIGALTAALTLDELGAAYFISTVSSSIVPTDDAHLTNKLYVDNAVTGGLTNVAFTNVDNNFSVGQTSLNFTSVNYATQNSHVVRLDQMNSAIAGLDWQESVISFLQFAGGEPTTPTIGDRYIALFGGFHSNHLKWSEDFTQVWGKTRTSIDSNVTIAPDGEMTADKLVDTTDTNNHTVSQGNIKTIPVGSTIAYSVFMKKADFDYGYLRLTDNAANVGGTVNRYDVVYDLVNGVVSDEGASAGTPLNPFSSIQDVGDGWYRCTVGMTKSSAELRTDTQIYTWNSPNIATNPVYTGTGTDGTYIWGGQLEEDTLTGYIKTEGTAPVTEPFLPIGNVTGQMFVGDHVYTWNGVDWTDLAPNFGFTTWVQNIDTNYTYNDTAWVEFGSTVSHNNTTGLQGGIAAEYYHLSQTRYDEVEAMKWTNVAYKDEANVFTLNQSSNPAPTVGDHLTNKTYVDSEISGLVLPITKSAVTSNFFTSYNSITGLFTSAQPIIGDVSGLQSALDLKYNAADFNGDFDTRLATKDTGDLSEGSNLYYTEGRVSANTNVSTNTAKISFDSVSSTRLANTSGTNTGDQNLSGYATLGANTFTGIQTIGSAHTINFDFLGSVNTSGGGILFRSDNPTYYSAIRGFRLANSNTVGLKFYTSQLGLANQERMVINDIGNVGIGTTSPDEALEVVGNGLFSGTVTASNLSGTNTGDQDLSGYATLGANTFTGNQTVDTASDSRFRLYLGGVNTMQMQAISGIARLSAVGGSTNFELHTNGTSKLTISAGGNATFSNEVSASNLSGTNTGDQDLSGLIGGSGTTNYIPKFTASGTIGNSVMYDNGTNVGIGTTTPDTKLEVKDGNVSITNAVGSTITLKATSTLGITTNSIFGEYNFYSSDASVGGVGITGFIKSQAEDTIGVKTYLALGTRTSINAVERMRIDSSGNVGIGTSSPTNANLVIETIESIATLAISGGNTTIASVGEINSSLEFRQRDGSIGTTDLVAGKIVSVSEFSNGAWAGLGFYTVKSGVLTEKMRINYDGNVGINTTTPSQALDVLGNGVFSGTVTATGDIYSNGTYYYGDGKIIMQFSDAWLRINQNSAFSSGIYCGSSIIRTDNELQVGNLGGAFKASSSGVVTASGSVTAASFIKSGGTSSQFLMADGSVSATSGWVDIGSAQSITGLKTFQTNSTYKYSALVRSTITNYPAFFGFRTTASEWQCGVDSDTFELARFTAIGGGTTVTQFSVSNVGNGVFLGSVTATDFILSSDRTLKENIKVIEPRDLKTEYVNFNFIGDKQARTGLIAQDVKKLYPEYVRGEKDGSYAISYTDLHNEEIAYLKKEVKELRELVMKHLNL